MADGYQTGATNMVHVNMGWGGSYNAYYDINNNWATGDTVWGYQPESSRPLTHICAMRESRVRDPSSGWLRARSAPRVVGPWFASLSWRAGCGRRSMLAL